ncbi:MAG: ASKHA domain-containing protein [Kiritimatiellaeota bacterium]|nr:ASKHA domain-containing protein [Kiritimatiellota bacterium]
MTQQHDATTHAVTFLPAQKSVRVPYGATVWQAARQVGLLFDTPCNGAGTCAKCRVHIRAGRTEPQPSAHRLTADELARGWRMACVTTVTEPLEVEIPDPAHHLHTILMDGDPVEIRCDRHPRGTLGVAFDLGTTTVAGALFDLSTGTALAVGADMNRQIQAGDDVISRIAAIRQDPGALRRLQALAVETLNGILRALCEKSATLARDIRRVTVAGNTTMQQILLGLDPSPLGEKPFTPAFTDAQALPAAPLGLDTHPGAELVAFPQIGGFVGGDTVAGLLATHVDTLDKPTLFVDIGTNGEIALLHGRRLFAASTAAGPAFEGARIRQGMRAATGAIDQIWLQAGTLRYHVIGNMKPRGLCGSALIDAAALLLQFGLLSHAGTLEVPALPPKALNSQLIQRLAQTERGASFGLAMDRDGNPLVSLTQQDVRELQLASGAIRAGIDTLLKKAGIAAADLDTIRLAGGFGNYIRCEHAMRIGLLPRLPHDRIEFIGNASLTGAKRALLSRAELQRAQSIRSQAVHVELASEPGFSDCFMDAMMFGER